MKETKEYIVLSVFDGMSCGNISFKELGIPIKKYYASEIDKPAIKQTQHNFPNTIQLGDVTNVRIRGARDPEDEKAIENAGRIFIDCPDIFLGGSPCQGFSFAGKQLNFEDPRSALFFEYVRLWREIKKVKPNALFLLENVNMKKEFLRVISEHLEVFPVRINSNLVSAQNRDRWYWTNIRTKHVGLFQEVWSDIPQPEDRKILLKDILQPENEVKKKYYLSQKAIDGFNKHKKRHVEKKNGFGVVIKGEENKADALLSRDYKHAKQVLKLDKGLKPKPDQDKESCFTAGGNSGGKHSDMDIISIATHKFETLENGLIRQLFYDKEGKLITDTIEIQKYIEDNNIDPVCVAMRGRNPDNPSDRTTGANLKQRLEAKKDGKYGTLTNVSKDNLILQRKRGFNQGNEFEDKSPTMSSNAWEQNNVIQVNPSKESAGKQPYQQNRVYHTDGKKPSLMGEPRGSITDGFKLRRLTPIECARLQTIPEWYEWIVSDTQIYKMLGNGWTVETIKHIFSFIKL